MTKPSFGTQVTVITYVEKPVGASAISVYAPGYLGKYDSAHPTTYNEQDVWTVYATVGSTLAAGVYYYNSSVSSSPIKITTSSATILQGKLISAMEDIAWAEKNGYQTASAYGGFDSVFTAMGAVRAYIDELFANTINAVNSITIATGGTILSQNYATGVSGFRMAGASGDVEFANGTFRGTLYASSGSIGGTVIESLALSSSNYEEDDEGFPIEGYRFYSSGIISAEGALLDAAEVRGVKWSGAVKIGSALSAYNSTISPWDSNSFSLQTPSGAGSIPFYNFNGSTIVQAGLKIYFGMTPIAYTYLPNYGEDRDYYYVVLDAESAPDYTLRFYYGSGVGAEYNYPSSYSSFANCSMCAMSKNSVALIDSVNKKLQKFLYDFGEDILYFESSLDIAVTGTSTIINIDSLTSDKVAYVDSDNKELRVYKQSGTTWSVIASCSVSAYSNIRLATLNSSDIAVVNNATTASVYLYRISGSSISKIESCQETYLGTSIGSISSLNGTDIVAVDTSGLLQIYRYGYALSVPKKFEWS